MPTTCIVPKCGSEHHKGEGISFFSFPSKDEHRLTAWITAINRPNWIPKKCSRICSKHFTPHDYLNRPGKNKKLKNNAVPSVFLSKPVCKQIGFDKIQDKEITSNKENEDKENSNRRILYESTKNNTEISNMNNEIRKELYPTQISPGTSHVLLVEDMDIDKNTSNNLNEDKENVNSNRRILYESTKNNTEISNTNNEVRKELYPTQISPGTSHVLLVEGMDIDKSTSSNNLYEDKENMDTNTRMTYESIRAMSSHVKELKYRHKIRILQQKIRRKNQKINSLKELVAELKKQVCFKSYRYEATREIEIAVRCEEIWDGCRLPVEECGVE